MVWYPHLFKNFPQFLVIHTVKGFGIVNKAEIDVFLELSCFFDDLIFRNLELAARAAVRKTSLPLATVTLIPHLTGVLRREEHWEGSWTDGLKLPPSY